MFKLFVTTVLALGVAASAAVAQTAGSISHDAMSANSMSHSAMTSTAHKGSDSMKHDTMSSGGMNHAAGSTTTDNSMSHAADSSGM